VYGVVYLFVTSRAGIPEAAEFRGRILRVLGRAG
jgi:hypothetical protein